MNSAAPAEPLTCPPSPQGLIVRGRAGSEHHLQQNPGPGPPPEDYLSEPTRRHHSDRGGGPDGHQRVPVPVPTRTLELLGPGGEDGVREGAQSG